MRKFILSIGLGVIGILLSVGITWEFSLSSLQAFLVGIILGIFAGIGILAVNSYD